MKIQNFTAKEALGKIMKYCAYQERCHKEVKEKLLSYGLSLDDSDEIMIQLIQENFLNEERFTRSFIRGKFRIKKWGRIKIRHALRQKNIPDKLIVMSMNEINETDYLKSIKVLFNKKKTELGSIKTPANVKKLTNYLIQKGYEADLIWNQVRKSRKS